MKTTSAVLFLFAVFLPLAISVPTPLTCPLTGKPPSVPNIPSARCLDAAKSSCCEDCSDFRYALNLLTADVTKLVADIQPDYAKLVPEGTEIQFCSMFEGKESCSLLVESMICAITCNPGSSNYVTFKNGATTVTVCEAMANRVYDACSGLTYSSFKLSTLIKDASGFMSGAMTSIVKMATGLKDVTINVDKADGKCYTGPKALPKSTSCCNNMAVPGNCPAGVVDANQFSESFGKIKSSASCGNATGQSAPPPLEYKRASVFTVSLVSLVSMLAGHLLF
ncbi:hypothetical protein CLOM_g4687 [Closterium sp. NIES-68]|nr:hypothetical protein CLOM_g4687 [Closterium sp. NIES-68]GJP57725.1 hypothetical protein CLOP_g17135 [Closterium sp. NIES-67]